MSNRKLAPDLTASLTAIALTSMNGMASDVAAVVALTDGSASQALALRLGRFVKDGGTTEQWKDESAKMKNGSAPKLARDYWSLLTTIRRSIKPEVVAAVLAWSKGEYDVGNTLRAVHALTQGTRKAPVKIERHPAFDAVIAALDAGAYTFAEMRIFAERIARVTETATVAA